MNCRGDIEYFVIVAAEAAVVVGNSCAMIAEFSHLPLTNVAVSPAVVRFMRRG